MDLTYAMLAPLHAASNDSTRYQLNGVHFEADGTIVATDGCMLAAVVPAQAPESVDGVEALEPFTMGAADAKRVSAELRKHKGNGPAGTLNVSATNKNPTARIITGSTTFAGEKVEASDFPDWRKVLPDPGDAVVTVGLNVALLERACKIAKQYGAKTFKVSIGDGDLKPVRFDATNPDESSELVMAIMPFRLS